MTSVAPDIAVIGGGIAGATAAAMLGKAGHEVVFMIRIRSNDRNFAARSLMNHSWRFCA